MNFRLPRIDFYGYVKKRLDFHLPDVRNVLAQELLAQLSAMPTASLYSEAQKLGLSAVNSALDAATAKYPIAKVLVPFLRPLLQNAVTQVVSTEHLDNITHVLTDRLVGIVSPSDANLLIAAQAAKDAASPVMQEAPHG